MAKQFPLAEHFVLKGYIDAVANKAGLTAQYTDNVNVPMTDGNVMYIPRPNTTMTEADGTKLRWWVLHETLHHTEGNEIFDIMRREQLHPTEDVMGKIFNLFEDGRIEQIGASKYEGDKKVLNDVMELFIPELIDVMRNVPPESWDKAGKTVGAALGLDILARAGWNTGAALHVRDFIDAMPEDVREVIAGLADAGWVDRVENLESTEDCLELAKILWEEVNDEPPPEPTGGGDASGEEDGDGQSGGESSQEQSGDGEGGDDPADGSGSDSGGNKGDKVPTGLREVEFSHHEWDDSGWQSAGVNITYPDGVTHGDYQFASFDEIYVADMVSDYSSDCDVQRRITQARYSSDVADAEKYYDRMISKHTPSRGFSNKVRQLLQVRSQAYYVGGQKKGKLNGSALYRAGCPKMGDGEWNKTVYKRKVEADIQDSAVFILCDGSGSMGGDRYAHATEAARMLNHSISKTLRIPTMIGVFTEAKGTHGRDCVIAITKHFDKPISDDKLVMNMHRSTTFMSVNPDGDALMWAYKVLRDRKEKRKILIVLSDGQPTGSRAGNTRQYTKDVAKLIEREGIVDIAAIGIQSDAPLKIYSDASVIKRPDELEQALLSVIKRKIIV